MKQKELWLPFPDFSKRYEVSNLGRYRSLRWTFVGSQKKIIRKILKLGYSPKFNYLYASVREGRRIKTTGIHVAVARAFVDNADPELNIMVNHKDGDRCNNCASNLEWCTASQNQKHAYETGLRKKPYGSKNGRCLLTEDEVMQIFNSDENHYFLAARYDIGRTAIGRIKSGKSWSHITGKEYTKKSAKVFTRSEVMEIFNSGLHQVALAAKFNVAQGTISAIKTGRAYSEITGAEFKGNSEYSYYGVKNQVGKKKNNDITIS